MAECQCLLREGWKDLFNRVISSSQYPHQPAAPLTSSFAPSQTSMKPVVRGRKLVLQYTNGSPCDSSNKKRKIIGDDDKEDDDDDDDDKKHSDKKKKSSSKRRKSTIISLLCEREPLDSKAPRVAVSFIGVSPDECAYSFEVRSPISCASRNKDQQGAVGPGGVFGIMFVKRSSPNQ